MRPVTGLPQQPRCKDTDNLRTRLEAGHQKLPNGCWQWLGAKTGATLNGYGRIMINYRVRPAHRIAYMVFKGPLDPSLLLMHKCDNRSCINPGHLTAGTKKDNTQDAISKGRFKYSVKRFGSYNPRCKLTTEQVLEIKTLAKSRMSPAEIKRTLNLSVSLSTINQITAGTGWKHLNTLADFTPESFGRWPGSPNNIIGRSPAPQITGEREVIDLDPAEGDDDSDLDDDSDFSESDLALLQAQP